MKKFGFCLFLVFGLGSCASEDPLKELDKVLDNAPKYEQIFRRKIDSLNTLLGRAPSDSVRFRTAWALNDSYRAYNIDTSLTYANLMLENARTPKERIIAQSTLVFSLTNIGRHQEAEELFNKIQGDFPYDDDMHIYYECASHLYTSIAHSQPGRGEICRKIRHEFHERLLQQDTTSYFAQTYMIYEKNRLRQYEEARKIARAILARKDLSVRYRAITEFNLGNNYQRTGLPDEAIKHYIRSAIIDLSTGTKEYNSLYMLARCLYEKGDNERACRYMLRTMNDATFCNYQSHYRRSANAAMMIHRAFLKENTAKTRRQAELILVLFLLLGVSFLLLIVRQLYARRQRIANEKIRITNLMLKDDNRIRDLFLSKYMEKTAYYIDKVDEMKSVMRRTYREEGLDAILKLLRSPAYADKEFKLYFQEFDESINRLFPTFVEEANRLMSPSHPLCRDENGAFSMELRILALIRLGITDNNQIAKALHIAISTLYTYRYRMRRDARCPAEEFEKKVREIGLYN